MTKRKFLSKGLLLSLVLVVMIGFSSCGETKTLEDFMNDNAGAKQQVEALSGNGLDVEIKDNTVTYTYKYTETFSDDVLEQVKTQLETSMDAQSTTFEGVVSGLEKEAEIEGVVVKVIYQNGDGSTIYEKEFK